MIIADMEKSSFSLLNFYERRVRRILPALLFVMFCTLPFAWFWMLPQDLNSFSQSLIAVPLFVSNVLFFFNSGYFDTESKPLLHTWSLAVEEQYYILFPLFLILAWKLGKKWIILFLLLVAITSVLVAQWGSTTHPQFTFYLLPTRGFEILMGALISLFINRKPSVILVSKSASQLFSIFGLLLIFYAIFVFDKNTPTPSLYTLIPTIGAGLIIVFANSGNLVGKLLSSKLFVSIGLISYSVYLWHQPLIVFAKLRSIDVLSNYFLGALCILSIILGYLSWKFIETPFRNKNLISSNKIFTYGAVGSLFFIMVGFYGSFLKGIPSRVKIPLEVSESIVSINLREKCDINFDVKNGRNTEPCIIGYTNKSNLSLAIFGDSHSVTILPALDKIGKDRMEKYVHIGLDGCPPLINIDVAKGNWKPKICEKLSQKQYDFVKANKVKNVLLVSRWSLYTDGSYDNSGIYYLVSNKNKKLDENTTRLNFEKSLKETIENYQKIGVNVYVMAQVPQQKFRGDVFYSKLYWFNVKDKQGAINNSSISKIEHLKLQNFNRKVISKLQNELKFTYIELDKEFCDKEKCYFGTELLSKYIDNDHLTTNGALALYNPLSFHIKTK